MKKQILRLTIIILSGALLVSRVQAQSLFTYSGGNGTPLTLTLNSDIQFTVSADVTAQYGIGFSITNAFASPQTPNGVMISISSGLVLSDSLGDLPATSANVGVPFLTNPDPGLPYNTANLNETTLYLFYSFPSSGGPPETVDLPAGDVITLSAGSAVTTGNFSWPTPALATDATVVVHDGMANLLDAIPAEPVPEPATLAFAGLGALGCVLMFWRRKS
ncbi:MAG: PEP-CTERM sorting domain-containing protein [Verrucomicrobiia bacterium]|jgi:hypothetical protein